MKNKYLEMHQDLMGLCQTHNMRLIAGKVAYLDYVAEACSRTDKTYFLFTEDYLLFESLVADYLSDVYSVKTFHREGRNRHLKIVRNDIFASNLDDLLQYPKGSFHPGFSVREMKQMEDEFLISFNKSDKHIPKPLLDNLVGVDYLDGKIYLPENSTEFYDLVYGLSDPKRMKIKEYEYFSEYVDVETFIKEARANGFISKKQRNRLNEYREWVRNTANPAFKAFGEYKKIMKQLRLPEDL